MPRGHGRKYSFRRLSIDNLDADDAKPPAAAMPPAAEVRRLIIK